MSKKKLGKAFWKNFKFKYKITIINENTLEEVAGLRVSKLNGVSVLLVVLTILFAIAATIIAFTPLRNYLPGYMNTDTRRQIVESALRLDSLQMLAERQNLYIMNIQDIQLRYLTAHAEIHSNHPIALSLKSEYPHALNESRSEERRVGKEC